MMKRASICMSLLLLLLALPGAWAALTEGFTIRDIRVEGLQRISAGTVFNYLPVKLGQRLEPKDTAPIIRALYKTGFFKDVRLEREGDVLIVFVRERPAIAKIEISGNKDIETEQRMTGLKDIGLAEGRVLNRFVLDQIGQELKRQYFNNGKYGVRIETTLSPLERNRVAINIDIKEGETARIRKINIVGNHSFDQDDLLDEFELTPTDWLSFITSADQYSRQKLTGDLERLRSYYLDRGFINFKITSTQVTITPDKRDIYIAINIDEGDVYAISDIKLAGNLVAPAEKFFPLIRLDRGSTFSRKQITASTERISAMLGDRGYAFANVNSIPEIDEENKQVALTFYVDPGKRVYVRRVNMKGNNSTRDEVLRREMRQMEAAWFSAAQVRNSRERLQRLGYFEEVNVETPAVPGSTDQVDVNVSVVEKRAGNLMAGVGFSQSQGLMFNASISQANFLGTGKYVSLGFDTSSANTMYRFSYTNPYYTVDGISRGFTISYQKTDFDKVDTSNYAIDKGQVGVNFGVPINETDRLRFNLDLFKLDYKVGSDASDEIKKFRRENGSDFLDFQLGVSWSHDSRDSAMMPTKGGVQRFSTTATIPGSDLEYYTIVYNQKRYFPLSKTFTLAFKGDIAYGDAYGDTTRLPPWENFFAGGIKTVRGYQDFSLGPRDSNGDPLGGTMRFVGNAEILFPAPFKLMEKTVRLSIFADGGQVYDGETDVDLNDIRYSVGMAGFWLSPFGALGLSLAMPFNDKSEDDIQYFQFSFGSAF
ncbi:MAG TPA: outer membrane protein assembly factor BamA [Sedimenticola sp.]|nr:outer membrane protein assembly factor BamA [Sedimenticola sp.]